jgi:RNA 2',3'-cyclic 3'-phosphodiesterase
MTEPAGSRLRLFVATSVPRAELEALDKTVAPVRPRVPSARWTTLENQHVTLKFLGSTPADVLSEVVGAMTTAARAYSPSKVRLGELGGFPSSRRARVLWVGIDDPSDLLRSLAAALDRAMEPLGYRIEKRPFTAHLTLARLRTPARLDGILPTLEPHRAKPWSVETVELFRSRLSPKGAVYEMVHAEPLSRPLEED